jgi:hypothetical protein
MGEPETLIPTLFKGDTVYLLASGPSLHMLDGKDWLVGRKCIAVNSSMYVGDYPQVLFFGDAKWYWWNKDEVQRFPGLKFTLNLCYRTRDIPVTDEPNLILLKRGHKHGLDKRPNTLGWNGSSGGAVMDLAWKMGAKRLILLGYDMRQVDGDRNYIHHVVRGTNKFHNMVANIEQLSKDLKSVGLEVFNATPGSALPWFPMISLKEALCSFPP